MPPAEHELRVELCRTIVAYDDEIAQLREDLEESQQELDKTRKSQSASKKRVVKLEVQLSESKSRVQELEEQLTEEKRRTEEYESSGCQAEIQQLLVRTQNTLKLTKARLDEEKARSRQGQVLIMTLRQQVTILEQRGRDDGQQISDLQEELKEAESLTKTVEPNLAACMHEIRLLKNKIDELSVLPRARRRLLEDFPTISVPEPAISSIVFEHRELASAMGGHRGWETKLSNDLAARHGLTACLYLTRRSNPWLPQRPGQHGYLFCGFEGKDEDNLKFAEPVERAIFIRERVNEWKYFGLYIVQRPVNSDLSSKEWRGLEDSLKYGRGSFSDLTMNKQDIACWPEYDKRLQKVAEEYDTGKRCVPCVTLQCVKYDEALFREILSMRTPPVQPSTGKRKR